jgi:uncharacterized protein (DUF927 family)
MNNQLTQTKDLSQSLDSISVDKLKKILHIGQDRLLELQQEIVDLQEHLKYIQHLIDNNK